MNNQEKSVWHIITCLVNVDMTGGLNIYILSSVCGFLRTFIYRK